MQIVSKGPTDNKLVSAGLGKARYQKGENEMH